MISCLLVSHNKPEYLHSAIESVLAQDADLELLIMDSGILLDKGYFAKYQDTSIREYQDARIRIFASGETEELRKEKAMAPWCFNEFFRRDLPQGDLISYLCDDDILYPGAFSLFQRWANNNPNMNAMYASIDVAIYEAGKEPMIFGQRKALEISGKGAYPCDCRVDYLQLCHRRKVFDYFKTDEYWPEDKKTEWHADGVFMDRLGEVCLIYPIPVKIGQNRRTPESTYNPVK